MQSQVDTISPGEDIQVRALWSVLSMALEEANSEEGQKEAAPAGGLEAANERRSDNHEGESKLSCTA